MAGIDAAFHRLEEVAFLQALGNETLRRFDIGPFQCRRRRLQRRRTQIRPYDPGLLDTRVGFQLDVLAKARFLRLRWQVDALTGHVVFPAVIGAAQPAFLVLPEPERNTAVREELLAQTDLALAFA